MRIKAYFLFPDNEDDFIRIGDNPQSYKDLIDEIAIIKTQLKNHENFELCYDSSNVESFLMQAETLIGGSYLAKSRAQLQLIFGNKNRNISKPFLRKPDCIYVHWNLNRTIEDAQIIIAEATESKQNEGVDKTVVINIADAYINNRENIHVIKDATHYNNMPILVSIPTVNNEIEFSQWLTTLGESNFSLTDKTKFRLTAFKWKKQKIYREIATDNLWYYDFFHNLNKKHFEVFNAQGIHLGEANTDGILDTTRVDNQKRIDDIIQ